MTTKIELEINDELKTFYQPSRIKGSAARVGLKIGAKMESLEDGVPDDQLIDEMLQFIAEYSYNNQFTAQELEDGLDARDLFMELSTQIAGTLSRKEKSGKNTKESTNSKTKISAIEDKPST